MVLRIPVILGTARKNSESKKVAGYLFKQARMYGFETELIDVEDYLLKKTDNSGESPKAKRFARIVRGSDGLIIVSPEYNHGYPGELKIMLDMLYLEYFKRAVGICGVSDGPWGGVRMVEQLRLVFIALRMVPINNALYFANVKTFFDGRGNPKDTNFGGRVKGFFDELSWFGNALKKAREKEEEQKVN